MASGMFFWLTSPWAKTVDDSAAAITRPADALNRSDIGCLPECIVMLRNNLPRRRSHVSKPRKCERLFFQLVASSEHPPHGGETGGKEKERHANTDAMADVSDFKKTPAETADQVNNGVEKCDCLPDRRQDAGGVE